MKKQKLKMVMKVYNMRFVLTILASIIALASYAVSYPVYRGTSASRSGATYTSASASGQSVSSSPITVSTDKRKNASAATIHNFGAMSAVPTISANGTATEPSAQGTTGAATTTSSVSGPRRAAANPPDDDTDPNPIGDALLPLMLLAFAYVGYSQYRRRKMNAGR